MMSKKEACGPFPQMYCVEGVLVRYTEHVCVKSPFLESWSIFLEKIYWPLAKSDGIVLLYLFLSALK
jgi:hypothetical protein